MAAPQPIRIQGLRGLGRDLRGAGGRIAKIVPDANQQIADEFVVQPARQAAKSQPGSTRKLAKGNAVRAVKKPAAAVVVIGGTKKSEWALGAEFGAKQYPQFQPWQGNQFDVVGGGPGYVVHPTIRKNLEGIEKRYEHIVLEELDKRQLRAF